MSYVLLMRVALVGSVSFFESQKLPDFVDQWLNICLAGFPISRTYVRTSRAHAHSLTGACEFYHRQAHPGFVGSAASNVTDNVFSHLCDLFLGYPQERTCWEVTRGISELVDCCTREAKRWLLG